MANRRTITIDGKRHDITGYTENWEKTCDGCGEFATAAGLVMLSVVLNAEGLSNVRFTIDVHEHCMDHLQRLVQAQLNPEPPF